MNLDRIAHSPTLVLVSFALAILGVVLATVFYYRSKREKAPRFLVTNRTLVEGLTGEIEGLQVLFQNQPQELITVARVHFWNAGRETIRREDLTPANPLRIECDENINVLDARVVHTSASSIAFDLASVQRDSNRAVIPFAFDYLDHGDGAVLQIIHTGTSAAGFAVEGKIKGAAIIQQVVAPALPRNRVIQQIQRAMFEPRKIGICGIVLGSVITLASLRSVLVSRAWYSWAGLVLGILFILVYISYVRSPSPLQGDTRK